MAEKYQESFDGNMRGLLENDGYLSNDEIELVIEKHLNPKEDKESLEESLKAMARNKFDNLEKLALYPNFMESIPLLSEADSKEDLSEKISKRARYHGLTTP